MDHTRAGDSGRGVATAMAIDIRGLHAKSSVSQEAAVLHFLLRGISLSVFLFFVPSFRSRFPSFFHSFFSRCFVELHLHGPSLGESRFGSDA